MPSTRSRRGTPTSRETPADTHLMHLTTEVLRLRLGQLNLVTTGSRSTFLTRLTTALKDRPNAPANQHGFDWINSRTKLPIDLFSYQQTIRDAQREFCGMA